MLLGGESPDAARLRARQVQQRLREPGKPALHLRALGKKKFTPQPSLAPLAWSYVRYSPGQGSAVARFADPQRRGRAAPAARPGKSEPCGGVLDAGRSSRAIHQPAVLARVTAGPTAMGNHGGQRKDGERVSLSFHAQEIATVVRDVQLSLFLSRLPRAQGRRPAPCHPRIESPLPAWDRWSRIVVQLQDPIRTRWQRR